MSGTSAVRDTAAPRVRGVLVTPPQQRPISLQDAKAHLRLTTSYEDAEIDTWIRVGTYRVERDTGLALMPQTWDLIADQFPSGRVFDLQPYLAPVQSVTAMTTTDPAGTPTVFASINYALVGNRIGLADAAVWPSELRGFAPIAIRVVAGYASAAAIPDDLLQLVRLVVGWQYRQVEPPDQKAAYDDTVSAYRTVWVP